MANLLRRIDRSRVLAGLLLAVPLVILAPLCAQYDKQPFSHKNHLGTYGATCEDCHATASQSTRASDSLLPSVDSCAQCHGPGNVKEPAQLTVSKFNHQLHVAIPGVGPLIAQAIRNGAYLSPAPDGLAETLEASEGCLVCHRGIAESEQVSKAVFPAMADCLVCHSDIDPPFSCEKCHDPGAALIPASHTADFLETHNTPQVLAGRVDCAVCHGRKFTCRGCH